MAQGPQIISIKSNFNITCYNTIRAPRGGSTARSGYATTIEGSFIFGDGVKSARGIRVQGHNLILLRLNVDHSLPLLKIGSK
jgi:hypothetical protein